MKHPSSRQLSDFVDGELSGKERATVEDHLATCTVCAGLVGDLEGIRRQAREVEECVPRRDLWPGIEEAIRQRPPGDAARAAASPAGCAGSGRSIRLTWPQAVAAGLMICLCSGAVGAYVARAAAPRPVEAVPADPWFEQVRRVRPELRTAAEDAARLETVLAEHSRTLDADTARLLARNLEIIDRAIEDALDALTSEPDNPYLAGHLTRAVQDKTDYLRNATTMVRGGGGGDTT